MPAPRTLLTLGSAAVTFLVLMVFHRLHTLGGSGSVATTAGSVIAGQRAEGSDGGDFKGALIESTMSEEQVAPVRADRVERPPATSVSLLAPAAPQRAAVAKNKILLGSRSCPAATKEAYASPNDNDAKARMDWCNERKNKYNVHIGRSWGGLSKAMQLEWDAKKCNELLNVGKALSCDETWGWQSFEDWMSPNNMKTIVKGRGSVKCASNFKESTFCQLKSTVLDFSKLGVQGQSRSFGSGFLQAFGEKKQLFSAPDVPGRELRDDATSGRCDETESRPTFVVSNDDIFNLGHYINDVMGVWAMLVMANRDSRDALLINIDGVRAGGPAGGPPHRLMIASDPDKHGPYHGYYDSWFAEVRKGVDYGKKRVCFSELYFPPSPGVPWFWNDWGALNECAAKAASPLYQSFNLFLRARWAEQYGPEALPAPDTDRVHVVVEVRAINQRKTNNHSSARHIKNLEQLVRALSAIPGVRVTAQDFAQLSFSEQVKLSHSAGVFVSMHGAGTTHIFHSAVGAPNCCALVELQPDHSINAFFTAQGYQNLARMHGLHYYRYEASMGRTSAKGTEVDVAAVAVLVAEAAKTVAERPTCVHDAKDTRRGVYDKDFF